VTPLAVSALQLPNHHLQFSVTYGGADAVAEIAGPIPQISRVNASLYSRVLLVNLYYLAAANNRLCR
jgi:hypothetical protein